MTPKHEKFVLEYIACENGAEAYRRAGYKCKNDHVAAVGADNLLTNPDIKTAVDIGLKAKREVQQESLVRQLKEHEVDQDYIIKGLKENAERAMQRQAVLNKESGETIEYRYEGSVANRAFELLGKTVGLFSDKVELTGKGGSPLSFTEVRLVNQTPGQPSAAIPSLAVVSPVNPADAADES